MLKHVLQYDKFLNMVRDCPPVREAQNDLFHNWGIREVEDHPDSAYGYRYTHFLGECYISLLETLSEEKEHK